MTNRWEYTYIEGAERKLDALVGRLNEAGSEGWEAFATVALKKGIAADSVAIICKRVKS